MVGSGWLGQALALNRPKECERLVLTTTSTDKLRPLSEGLGAEARLLRIDNESPSTPDQDSKKWPEVDSLLVSIPPLSTGPSDEGSNHLANLLRLCPATRSVLYVSSTSVYGQNQGRVDENTQPAPDSESGKLLLQVEEWLRAWVERQQLQSPSRSCAATVLRSGGQFGPGRHPGRFLGGRRDVPGPHQPVNLIHQDDLVDIIWSEWRQMQVPSHREADAQASRTSPLRNRFRLINAVCPDHPTRLEYYTQAAVQLGLEAPQFRSTQEADEPLNPGKRVESLHPEIRGRLWRHRLATRDLQ